jgi:hypothetical protein
MSRGIRNAARAVAVAYGLGALAEASEARPLDPVSVPAAELERLSWTQMVLRGLSQHISVLDDERTVADVTLAYVRDDTVAEILMGPGMLNAVLDRAGPVVRERHLVVVGVDGPAAGALNLARLSIVQGADTVGLSSSDVLLFGPPREGKLDGEFRMARVLLFDRAVDMTRPLTFVLDLRPGLGVFSAEYPGERQVVDSERAGSARPPSRWSARPTVLALFIALAVVVVAAVFLSRRSR